MIKERFQDAINADLSDVICTRKDVREVLERTRGEKVMKKKISTALVFAIILVLVAGAALAVAISLRDTGKQVLEIEQSEGYYSDWSIESKIALVSALVELGYTEKTAEVEQLLSGSLPKGDAARIADEAVVVFAGVDLGEISYMAIMEAAWGPFERWTTDEQAWDSQLRADMGLQGADHTLYVQPTGPIDEAGAVAIARAEIAKGFGVDPSTLDAYQYTRSFQVPEFAQEGDLQPYWYIAYSAPESMSEETRLFDTFWVFIHPVTGELLESVESLRESFRAYEAEVLAHQTDPLAIEINAFFEAHGLRFREFSLEAKALWSETIRPKMIAKQQAKPGFFTDKDFATAAFVYGLPDDTVLSEEQALEIAQKALIDPLGRKADELYFFMAHLNVYYDITDEEKPLWKFFFQPAGIYDSNKALAAQALSYYGEERVPNFKVEIDALTGEVIAAYAVDFADLNTVEDWMKTM